MKPHLVGFALVSVVLSVCATGARHVNKERHLTPGRHANEPDKVTLRMMADHRGSDTPRNKTGPRLVSAPSDTFVLGAYSFDTLGIPDAQGWYSVERTAQTEIFTHVADSTELNGGFFGSLVPIAGQQSAVGEPVSPFVIGEP
ncbi:MAG: hypothetical protein O7D32_07600, partial [bacterium]|nr:hypothetical protein [bacterium]